jgi:hypothetical protein
MGKKLTPEELKRKFPRKPLTIAELRKKYPWVVPNSLKGRGNDRTVEIKCSKKGCAVTRRVRTMDAFQVRLCQEHQREQDQIKTNVRRRKWRERDRERRRAMQEGEP